MNIGLDIDNVISEFDEIALEEFYKEDKNKRNKGIVNPEGEWVKYQFDWSKEECEEFFLKNMERMAKEMNPKREAKYFMDKLLEEGHALYLISNRVYPVYKNAFETTTNWLKKHGINYTKLVLSETTNKSKECFECNVDVMFDDVQFNCHKLEEAGINCYLVQTRYNAKDTQGLKVVKDWQEIYNVICELEENKMRNADICLKN